MSPEREIRDHISLASVEDVQRLVRSRTPGDPPLHIVSTGRSWGMGSSLPASGPVDTIDLAGMSAIRDLNLDRGYAVVEPGVTQGQLASALSTTSWMVNVTVSSAHTSIVGNLLDRGVGLRHQRTEDVLGLEVVLADGSLSHLGWWPDGGQSARYRHGLGPDLLPAFQQSSFGAVTAAVIRLIPRPEAGRLLQFTIPEGSLADAMDEVRHWVTQGVTRAVVKVYSPAAAAPYGATSGHYLAHVYVDGPMEIVDASSRWLIERARVSGHFGGVDIGSDPARSESQCALDRAVTASYQGDPDETDHLFESKMGVAADEIDERLGFLMYLPLVPFRGSQVAAVAALVAQQAMDTPIGVTFNALDTEVIDCVVTVRFAREEGSRALAWNRLESLASTLSNRGYQPYRLGADLFGPGPELVNPTAQAVNGAVKNALDPDRVFASGRYSDLREERP
ncbi:FAD-binding oxidoreductase [Knoellia sp. CPCC 206453]|uniref:FAD-binding oxidoreductase n=1 Tax=Knoellia pratensis TaxID=3404796 RepID=UPI00361F8FB8